MTSTNQVYRQITSNLPRALERAASGAAVKRETDYYKNNISNVKTIDEFVNNRRLFNYAMKAFGLEDMSYAKALVRKALTEGVESSASFANRLVDPRLKEFVTAFNFARRGEFTTSFAETQQGTVDRYIRQTLEEDAGAQSEGARLALYFSRKAPDVNSVLSLLGDKALTQVLFTALDIPTASASRDLDKLVTFLETKVSIEDFRDPAKLKSFLDRFAIKWDLANPSAAATSTLVSPLLSGPSQGLSTNLLTAIQSLRIGGRR